jgi:hypothetical protein
MDRHVASSKSLETESAGYLEECENLEPSLAIERVVQHIMSDLARLSTYYPTVPMRLRKDRPDNDRADSLRKNRRWHRTAKNRQEPDAGTVLPRTTNQTTIAPIRLLSRPDDDRADTPAIYDRPLLLCLQLNDTLLLYCSQPITCCSACSYPIDPCCSACSRPTSAAPPVVTIWNGSDARKDNVGFLDGEDNYKA